MDVATNVNFCGSRIISPRVLTGHGETIDTTRPDLHSAG
jgi:hypothetical protein